MASGNSINHTIALGTASNVIPDPGSGGTINPQDGSLVYVAPTTAGAETRYLEDGTQVGQIVMVINNTGNTITLTDKASSANTVASIATLETALCVYTGLAADPWHAVILGQGAD